MADAANEPTEAQTPSGSTIILKETTFHHQVFNYWYGALRDSRATAAHYGVTPTSIWNWMRSFHWHERADALDHEAEKKVAKEAIKRRAEMIERHRKAGQLMMIRAHQYFINTDVNGPTPIERAADAINAMKHGIEIEREAEGLPTWIFSLLGADNDTLAAIIRQAAAEQLGGGGDSGEVADAAGERDPDAGRYSNTLGQYEELGSGEQTEP